MGRSLDGILQTTDPDTGTLSDQGRVPLPDPVAYRPPMADPEPDPPSWQDYANCLGVDPDVFFPQRGESAQAAKAICAGCTVREECLEANLHEKKGVWGGMDQLQRQRLRAARARARAASA